MATIKKRKAGRPVDPGLRTRRREEILATATAIFAERGYARTDVQAVADRLDVGKGTIYRYFPSKRALFLAVTDFNIRRLHDQVESDTRDIADPLEKIARGIYSYLSFFDAHPELAELLIQERAEFKDRKTPTYFEHKAEGIKPWRELTRDLIARGRLRDIPVDEILDVVDNLLYGTMFTNFFTGRRKSCREQVREILDIVFHGVLSENERKRSRTIPGF